MDNVCSDLLNQIKTPTMSKHEVSFDLSWDGTERERNKLRNL